MKRLCGGLNQRHRLCFSWYCIAAVGGIGIAVGYILSYRHGDAQAQLWHACAYLVISLSLAMMAVRSRRQDR